MQGLEHPGSHVQGTVLEPCKVGVRLDLGGDAGDIQLTLSDLRMNLSPDVLELALSLQSSVLEPLVQPPPDRCTHLPIQKGKTLHNCDKLCCLLSGQYGVPLLLRCVSGTSNSSQSWSAL